MLVAAVGGGAVGGLTTPWAQWAVEKAKRRTDQRRKLIDDGWATIMYVWSNLWASAPLGQYSRHGPKPEKRPRTHDLLAQQSVMRLLDRLTEAERAAIEQHHLVKPDAVDGLHILEEALRRLARKWRLS